MKVSKTSGRPMDGTVPVQPNVPREGWAEVIRGGDRVVIRPIHADYLEMEGRFIEGLSPESRRFRFFDTMRSPSDKLLHLLTAIDSSTDVAYGAVIEDGDQEQEVGVARFSAGTDGTDCEFAVTVSDEWQCKGLGSHPMPHLIAAARERGILRMHSSDDRDNNLMREFAAHLHFDHQPDPDDPALTSYSVNLTPLPA